MNTVQVKIIAAGVVALLVVWAATALLPSGTDRPTADFRLPTVVADSVDTITVTTPGQTVTVGRAPAGSWTASGVAASGPAVDELFAALRDSVRPELVARSATSFARLGVDTTAARRLTVSGRGRVQLDLLVSDRSPEGGGAYLRLPADSAVYAWSGRLGSIVRRTADEWRDRVIGRVNTDSVRRVNVERGARRYALQRRDGRWVFAGGRPADSTAVANFLERFRTVTASGFPTPVQLDSAFRGRRERRVALLGPADSTILTLDLDSMATGFWVRRSVEGTVYRLGTWEAEQLTPADSTLRRRAAP